MAIDMGKLNAFIGQFVGDLGAAVNAGMVVIGERLGLYKALAGQPMSSAELAAKTKTDERYVREWLASQAAGGYVTYDEKTNKFSLTEEQAFALAKEDSPAYLPGAFQLALVSSCINERMVYSAMHEGSQHCTDAAGAGGSGVASAAPDQCGAGCVSCRGDFARRLRGQQ